MDKEKNPSQKQEPKVSKTEKTAPASASRWKRFTSKKWFFPAIYLGSAALILALIVWYQASVKDDFSIDENALIPEVVDNGMLNQGNESIPVAGQEDRFAWPVAAEDNAVIVMGFYDDTASKQEQARAVIQYGNEFYPNTGIDLSIDGKTSFDVFAAANGEVIRAEEDQVVGYVVEIKHQNKTSVYQSLKSIDVQVGDKVMQGDVIGQAGRNALDKELGVHVHFEVRNEFSEPLNPLAVLPAQN